MGCQKNPVLIQPLFQGGQRVEYGNIRVDIHYLLVTLACQILEVWTFDSCTEFNYCMSEYPAFDVFNRQLFCPNDLIKMWLH